MEGWDWKEHLGLIIAGVSASLVVARLYGVAGFQIDTALAILQASGPANVVLGTAVSLAPLVLYYALAFVVVVISQIVISRRRPTVVEIAITAAVGISAIAILPPSAFLAALCAVVLGGAIFAGEVYLERRRKRRPKRGAKPANEPAKSTDREGAASNTSTDAMRWLGHWPMSLRWMVGLFVGTLLPFTVLGSTPWVPSEALELRGAAPRTGYVLGRDGNDLIVLTDEPRSVMRVPVSNIESRTICSYETARPWLGFSTNDPIIPALVVPTDAYPPCP